MSNIDERVVGMRFDSSKFTDGAKDVMSNLDKLKASLKMEGATKGLEELDSAGKRFTLQPLAEAADGISGKFIALAAVGITALSNIVNKAIDAGQRIMNSLTIDPIKAGFDEYELKMKSIQTILANTSRYGTTLGEVTKNLDELNAYADKTIYNFGEMTRNIGLFTNAGIRIEDATSMIRGFSNAAAASGTNAESAARAAFQLSQALSAGIIRAIDWMSLTNAGMGNKNMQDGLYKIAVAMGKVNDGTELATKIQSNFRGSLEENWLTTDIMSNYLRIMAGDMDAAAMAAIGLSDVQIAAFMKEQKTAEEAATKVRTWTQLLGTLQESVGSSWSQTFDMIIGDFEEATDLFTNVNNTLGKIIGAASDARNNLVAEWVEEGGREAAIEGIASAFRSFLAVVNAVKKAFTNIFPPMTGKQIADITKDVRDFIKSLTPGPITLINIRRTAEGFFAVLSLGYYIISNVVKMVANLLGVVAPAGSGLLDLTATFGDFLVKLNETIQSGGRVAKFFNGLGSVLKVILSVVGAVVGSLADFIASSGEIADSGLDSFFDRVSERFAPIGTMFDVLLAMMGWVGRAAKSVFAFMAPFIETVGELAKGLANAIADSFKEGNFSAVLDFINAGLLGGILTSILVFVTRVRHFFGGNLASGGFFENIIDVFGSLSNVLDAMQRQIQAKTIMYIAAAVALLAASVVALSLLDSAKMAGAIAALAVLFGELIGFMAAFDAIFKITSAVKLTLLAVALTGLGVATLLFAGSVAILSALSWDGIARGLVALAGAMAIMSGAMILMSKVGPGAILGSVALTVAAAGMLVLAGALKILATLTWDDIGRGMATLGSSLAILAVGLTLMAGAIPGAAALVIASVGILVLSAALKVFSTLSWDDIGRGMATLGSTLAILAVGLTLMAGAIPGAAALLIASVALNAVAAALKIFATMSWDDIGRAMVLLGGTLAILAVGLTLMIASLPGAAALVVASAALLVLSGVLVILGGLSWDEVLIGLSTLALTLGILAAAGMLMTPAIPTLLGLGAAIMLLGLGVGLAGAGILALSIGLLALSGAGGAAILVLTGAISALAGLIPYVARQIGLGLIEIAKVIGESGPQILTAIATILLALVQALIEIIPPLIEAAILLVTELVNALIVLIPLLVDAGMKIVIGILDGIANNIGKVVEKGADVIVALLKGLAKELPRITDASAELIVKYLDGIGTAINKHSGDFVAAGSKIFKAIVNGVAKAIERGGADLNWAGKRIGDAILRGAMNALGIHSPSRKFYEVAVNSIKGAVNGVRDNVSDMREAGEDIGNEALSGLQKSMKKVAEASNSDIDSAPTIRPVLDLSLVKRDAGLIGNLVGGQTLAVDGATARANEIAAKYGEFQQAKSDANTPSTVVNLEQNNYSPKSLPAVEIYRNTNNQMSILKGELEKNAN
jgi:tape measure domain-containing protein